jgi:hypothetical protein
MTGFEPATSGSTIRRSNQLSYIHHEKDRLEIKIQERLILAKCGEAPQLSRGVLSPVRRRQFASPQESRQPPLRDQSPIE